MTNCAGIDWSEVRPLKNLVTVKWLDDPEKQGSIVIPDQCRNPQFKVPPREGVVIRCGPGDFIGKWNKNGTRLIESDYTQRDEIPLEPGDRILFNRAEANVLDEEQRIVALRYPQHILAKLEDGVYAPVPRRKRAESKLRQF